VGGDGLDHLRRFGGDATRHGRAPLAAAMQHGEPVRTARGDDFGQGVLPFRLVHRTAIRPRTTEQQLRGHHRRAVHPGARWRCRRRPGPGQDRSSRACSRSSAVKNGVARGGWLGRPLGAAGIRANTASRSRLASSNRRHPPGHRRWLSRAENLAIWTKTSRDVRVCSPHSPPRPCAAQPDRVSPTPRARRPGWDGS
jgi:hypothetical protein